LQTQNIQERHKNENHVAEILTSKAHVTDFRRQSVERPGWCEIAAQQPPQKKKATSSKASQKLSTNDVFAGESQTKKNYKDKKQEDGANSASGSKENDAAWQEQSAQKQRKRKKIPKP
jgi:hypothetical protein